MAAGRFGCAPEARLCVSCKPPAGQITVQPRVEKYSAFATAKITSISPGYPVSKEGRIAIVTDVGMGCGGRGSAR